MTVTIDLNRVRGTAPVTCRPAHPDDAGAVLELVNACELQDLGEALLEADDIAGDWQRPSFDLTTDSICLFDGRRLVGYGEVYKGRRADGCVHPDARGRGLGAALLRWTWDVSRARGGALVGQSVVDSGDAARLFAAYGYEPLWTSWILELAPGVEIAPAPLPAGTQVRPYQPGEERVVFEVVEDAFNEWPDRDASTFEDWAAGVLHRPGFEPWQLLVSVKSGETGAGEVIGVCYLVVVGRDAWISQLAVRADRRGRGLGRALLGHAFAVARERGATRCELSTDSRTGALSLYEHVGMRVRQSFTHYARGL